MWRVLVFLSFLVPLQALAGSVSWHVAPVNGSNYLPHGEKRLYRLSLFNGTSQDIRLSDVTVVAHRWVGYPATPHNSAYPFFAETTDACIMFDPLLHFFSPPDPPYKTAVHVSFVSHDAVDLLRPGASISCSFRFWGGTSAPEYRHDFTLIIPPANHANPASEQSIIINGVKPPVVVPALNEYVLWLMMFVLLSLGVFFMEKRRVFACDERTL